MTLQFAAFVVGAVLLLVAIAGGGFKLIGAELAEKVQNPWLRGIAGIAGVLLILWALTRPGEIGPPGPKRDERPVPEHRARMGSLEFDINRQGSDLSNFQVENAEACSTACERDERCKAMTFVKHPAVSGGMCWLKDSVAPQSPARGMISAVKIFE